MRFRSSCVNLVANRYLGRQFLYLGWSVRQAFFKTTLRFLASRKGTSLASIPFHICTGCPWSGDFRLSHSTWPFEAFFFAVHGCNGVLLSETIETKSDRRKHVFLFVVFSLVPDGFFRSTFRMLIPAYFSGIYAEFHPHALKGTIRLLRMNHALWPLLLNVFSTFEVAQICTTLPFLVSGKISLKATL